MTIIDILEKAITHLERSGSTLEERFIAADGLRTLIGKQETQTRHTCEVCNGAGYVSSGHSSFKRQCKTCLGSGYYVVGTPPVAPVWAKVEKPEPSARNYVELRKAILWKAVGAARYHGSLGPGTDYQMGYIFGRNAAVSSIQELMDSAPSADELIGCTDPDRKNCPHHCVVFCNKKTEAEDEP